MKHTLLVSAAALVLGAGSLTAQAAKAPTQKAAHGRRAVVRTVRVQMVQQGSAYKFVPANFSVHPGDVVEFVNGSGFPHNGRAPPRCSMLRWPAARARCSAR